jgi:hypothetical protein
MVELAAFVTRDTLFRETKRHLLSLTGNLPSVKLINPLRNRKVKRFVFFVSRLECCRSSLVGIHNGIAEVTDHGLRRLGDFLALFRLGDHSGSSFRSIATMRPLETILGHAAHKRAYIIGSNDRQTHPDMAASWPGASKRLRYFVQLYIPMNHLEQ